MATTADAVVDRVRAVLVALGYTEAIGRDFTKSSTGTVTDSFVVLYTEEPPQALLNNAEEVHGVVEIQMAYAVNDDYQLARRTLLQRSRTIANAVITDGAVTSGEYLVEDYSRSVSIENDLGASFLRLVLRLPVLFEASLA